MKNLLFLLLTTSIVFVSCKGQKEEDNSVLQQEVQTYLDQYNTEYQKLVTAASEGQWVLNTHIVEGDTMSKHNAAISDEAYSKFTETKVKIVTVQKNLKQKLTGGLNLCLLRYFRLSRTGNVYLLIRIFKLSIFPFELR